MFSRLLVALSLVLAGPWNGGCEKSAPNYSVIQPLATVGWGRALCEGLHMKSATDGTGDLLLMSPSTHADARQGLGLPAMKDLPIYRYHVKSRQLSALSSEIWRNEAAPETVCNEQELLWNYGEFTYDYGSKGLQFQGVKVSTAAPTVLRALRSPDKKYTSAISAEGKVKKGGWMPFGDPVIKGKRFHQVFRMSDAIEVGKAVTLAVETDRDDIAPCWSPDSRYVVYQDSKCEHLWIIEVARAALEDDKK